MRRSLVLLVTLATFAFVAACSAEGGGSEGGAPTTEVERTPTTDEVTATTEDDEETTTTEDDEETTTTEDDDEVSGGGDVDVDEWAAGFCADFDVWLAEIEAGGTKASNIPAGNARVAKVAIIKLFGDAGVTTENLIDSIEAGGAPDVDDGEALVSGLINRFVDFRAAMQDARVEAESLPSADPAAFQTQANDIIAQFQSEVTDVGDSFSELDEQYPSPELQVALATSCG